MKLLYGASPDFTESFRYAFRKHPLGVGLNANTLPKHIRHLYHPPPGHIFGVPDYSQAEVRLVAYLSQCKDLLEIFSDPTRNVHSENAAMVRTALSGVPYDPTKITKDSIEYVLGKSTVHAFNYMEGPWKFSWQTGIPFKDSKRLLEACRKQRPEIPEWHQELYDVVSRTGELVTPTGERRIFYAAMSALALTGKIPSKQWKELVSWIPQTVVPRITNEAMMKVYAALSWVCWYMQWHDAYVASMPTERMVEFAEASTKAAYRPIPIKGKVLVIPVNLEFGYNLEDLMPYKGRVITHDEWGEWQAEKLRKSTREARILEGVHGVHLKDWWRGRKERR